MKNADMPAMPLFNNNGSPVHHSSAGMDNHGVMAGLTKREMMAMHMMASLMAVSGYQTREHMAQDAIASTDALLAELEKQQ
ncbi:MAG: hypothetical protein ACRC91_19025 [Aeromonas sp.]